MLESKHPKANRRMNVRPRRSSAYIVIMNVSATTPYAVSKWWSVADHQVRGRVEVVRHLDALAPSANPEREDREPHLSEHAHQLVLIGKRIAVHRLADHLAHRHVDLRRALDGTGLLRV